MRWTSCPLCGASVIRNRHGKLVGHTRTFTVGGLIGGAKLVEICAGGSVKNRPV